MQWRSSYRCWFWWCIEPFSLEPKFECYIEQEVGKEGEKESLKWERKGNFVKKERRQVLSTIHSLSPTLFSCIHFSKKSFFPILGFFFTLFWIFPAPGCNFLFHSLSFSLEPRLVPNCIGPISCLAIVVWWRDVLQFWEWTWNESEEKKKGDREWKPASDLLSLSLSLDSMDSPLPPFLPPQFSASLPLLIPELIHIQMIAK